MSIDVKFWFFLRLFEGFDVKFWLFLRLFEGY